MSFVEYRVRPVTRYIVTRFHQDKNGDGSDLLGEFSNEDAATAVARAMTVSESPPIETKSLVIFTDSDGKYWRTENGRTWEPVECGEENAWPPPQGGSALRVPALE